MIGRMMVSALALSGIAYAQTPAPTVEAAPGCAPMPTCATPAAQTGSDRVVYDTAFFAQYNPRTALDMVRQAPGFSLDGGDDRRGFSGAVGNLLIDGLRPTSKSQSLDGILSRIPASQVVRIEVLRGAEVAGDASGQAVLLNVVRTSTAGSGVWEAGFEYSRAREVAAPRGELSYSGRNGQFEYGIGASVFSQYRSLPGWRVITDGAGALIETVDTPSPRDFREAAINANMAFPLLGGRLSATGQVDANRFQVDDDFLTFDPLGVNTRNLFRDFHDQNRGLEIGVNYDRDFGPWSMALVGLVNRSRYESDELAATTNGAGAIVLVQTQDVQNESGETILRGALSRNLGRHRIEIGAEGAFNSLDSQLQFTQDSGGGPAIIPISNSNVLVEEERAEMFGVHTWRPDDNWTLETRLAWETSTLNFTGDTNQSVELSFWKPSVQLTRSFAGSNQLRLRVYRDVGQLDFGDFTSAAAIADSIIAGGNPDLAPQTSWRGELGADLRFPGGAALGLTLTQHQITDVADVVKITPTMGSPYDAPGNIGDGDATSFEVNFSTPLTPIIPGGRLTIEGSLWDTEVTDPVTNQPRIISYRPESLIEINFRQDLSALRMAWGVSYFKEGENQAYRFNEIDTSEEGPWVDVFVETTALPNNMKLRATAANVSQGTIHRDRRFFTGDRNGPLVRRDLRERQFDQAPWLIVELSGVF